MLAGTRVARDRGDEPIPFDVPATAAVARSAKMFLEHLQVADVADLCPSPAERTTGSAASADLIEEQPFLAIDDAVIMRLGATRQSVQREDHQAPLLDRAPQSRIRLALNWKVVENGHAALIVPKAKAAAYPRPSYTSSTTDDRV